MITVFPIRPLPATPRTSRHQSVGYYVAAVVGIAIIAGITLLVTRMIAAREAKKSEG